MADGRPDGLSGAIGRLGASSLELLRTRVELAALEFAEEHERRLRQLLLIGIAVVAFFFALFAISAFVVAYFWDSHPLRALAGVIVVYVAIGVGALWRLAYQSRTAPRPFATTIAELERDRQFLAGQWSEPKP